MMALSIKMMFNTVFTKHVSYVMRCLSTSKCLSIHRFIDKTESHSQMLSDKEVIYELQTHNVLPNAIDKYLTNYQELVNAVNVRQKETSYEFVGSWAVQVGDLDQSLHLWRYTGGFSSVDETKRILAQDANYQSLLKNQGQLVRSRHVQYLLEFSYWPSVEPRSSDYIYEICSYRLKPGTMIEWGNNWARFISHRKNTDEAFAGFFSQIGRLYNVHHIWCYPSLQRRKETTEIEWRSQELDEYVAYTVPLISEMQSRILQPHKFSPTK